MTKADFAGLAMQALLSRPDLKIVFSNGDGPPRLNGYAIGPHGETHRSAEKDLAQLSWKLAEEMDAANPENQSTGNWRNRT